MTNAGISSHHVLWSIFSNQPKTAATDAVIAFITSRARWADGWTGLGPADIRMLRQERRLTRTFADVLPETHAIQAGQAGPTNLSL